MGITLKLNNTERISKMKIIFIFMAIGIQSVVIPEVISPPTHYDDMDATTKPIIGSEKLPKYGPVALCVKRCSRIFQPICGSDGVTYSNACELEKQNCLTGTIHHKKCDGTCDSCTEYISMGSVVPISPIARPRPETTLSTTTFEAGTTKTPLKTTTKAITNPRLVTETTTKIASNSSLYPMISLVLYINFAFL